MARKSRKNTAPAAAPEAEAVCRAAIYVRLSVEDKQTRTVSIETQQLIIAQFLERNPEISVYHTYIDNGATGTNFHRPGFQQMLSDIEAGLVNCVIVKDLSRLGRNTIDTGYYIETYFPQRNVRFIAVNENYDTANPDDASYGILIPLRNMINEAYALDIGRKIKASQRQMMKDGKYVGGRTPYGYLKADDDCHQLVIDPVAAPVVRQIFAWASEGAGLNTIAVRLNEAGIPAPSHHKRDLGEITHDNLIGSGKWQTFTVSKMHKGDTGGMDVAFKYLINEYYSRDMSIKTKSAKYAKMQRGEYQSKICPYGYRKSADGRMEPDPEVAEVVRLIFRLSADGVNAAEITRELYRRGIPTPGEYKAAHGNHTHDVSRTRGIWNSSTVLRMLEDERYTGTYVIGKRAVMEVGGNRSRLKDRGKWYIIPDHHPAIVDQATFEQAKANQLRYPQPNKKKRDYALKGKIFCGCCDHALSRTSNKTPYYFCRHSDADKALPCHKMRYEATALEQAIFVSLKKQMDALGADSIEGAGTVKAVFSQRPEYERQIEALEDNKLHLYEQYQLRKIDLDTYRTLKETLDAQLLKTKNAFAALTSQAKREQKAKEKEAQRKSISKELVEATGLTTALVNLLIDRVRLYPGGRIEIEYKVQDLFQ